ncbi:MAG: ABC transporter ATP-binding protein [Deltaproteobacteria bacterium]|jgi:iron(III) transport system ATP-binding protein|nr:ABC transporter ATP-binding protein [Deltaproteobacteria bacterium]
MPYIRLVNVTKRFGQVTAVNELNLEIEKGECFSMLGPSGCGKTTTLRMLAGFEDLSDGEIHVGGRLFSSPRQNFYLPPEKRDFGMVFQAFAVWPHLSVYENVAFPLRIRKLPKAEIERRATDALRSTNLLGAAAGSPENLSGGGKQRVALARALAINPDVMLLDEPLSSLDPHLREEMRFEIKELQRKYGFAIVYVTHDQAEAMALSDRIMVMRQGEMQQIDSPLNVYNNPANRFVFSFIGLSNFLRVSRTDGHAGLGTGSLPTELAPPEGLPPHSGLTLASRPSEIDFLAQGGLRGKVSRKSFLGEIVDYHLRLEDGQSLRVQKNRRLPGPEEGESCGLLLRRPFWYTDEN